MVYMVRLIHDSNISGVYKQILSCFIAKQAENGLQSRFSENGKTAVWHYGMKLHWYLTGDRDWRYGMVLYGFIGIVWYVGGGVSDY